VQQLSTIVESFKSPTLKTRRAHRIFLLSPANAAGIRARMLLLPRSKFALAERLREEGVPLGELFSFMSSLYFRGKLAYARMFAASPPGIPSVLIITPSRGLVSPDTVVTLRDMQEMASARVDPADPKYREPLERDAQRLMGSLAQDAHVVLLGSLATPKYVEPLAGILGHRLMYPASFLGLGDMSRGGLLLRCSRNQQELEYVSFISAGLGRSARAKSAKRPRSRRSAS
jgi:hypothetical protein